MIDWITCFGELSDRLSQCYIVSLCIIITPHDQGYTEGCEEACKYQQLQPGYKYFTTPHCVEAGWRLNQTKSSE